MRCHRCPSVRLTRAAVVRRVRRPFSAAAGLLVVVAALVVSAPAAWAHVTIHPDTLPAGSSDVEITFRVPNERDNANTVGLQVFFPSNVPLLTVEVLPVPGWTESVHTRNLSTPVQTDDGPVSQVVSDVTWTATTGGIAEGTVRGLSRGGGRRPRSPRQVRFQDTAELLVG